MEAICKADYDQRVIANETLEKNVKQNTCVKVQPVGYHDIYGLVFRQAVQRHFNRST